MSLLDRIVESIKNFFLDVLGINSKNTSSSTNQTNANEYVHHKTLYRQKPLMTNSELTFFNKLKYLETNYRIVPQLNLATVIQKINNNKYNTDLFRIVDFAIFNKDYSKLLLLIELNDKTHETKSRKRRDFKVSNICRDANIKLITFYTKYPNEEQYVINRILKEINSVDNNIN